MEEQTKDPPPPSRGVDQKDLAQEAGGDHSHMLDLCWGKTPFIVLLISKLLLVTYFLQR